MVEAFSIRGLGRLAESWLRDPPFPDDSAYGGALQTYRDRLIERYSRGADGKSIADTAAWFTANLEISPNVGDGLKDQAATVWAFEGTGLATTSIPSVNLTP